METNVTDRCFSKTALATYLGKSIRWVDAQLAGSDPPPGYKIGKSWVFKKSEIDQWLESFRVNVDPDTASSSAA